MMNEMDRCFFLVFVPVNMKSKQSGLLKPETGFSKRNATYADFDPDFKRSRYYALSRSDPLTLSPKRHK